MSGTRTSEWWSDRWAWRGALGLAPFGALAAILHALLVLRAPFDEALVAYALGAMLAAGFGCLFGGSLGAFGVGARRRFGRTQRDGEHDAHDALLEPTGPVDAEPVGPLDAGEAFRAAPDGARQLTLDEAPVDPYPDLSAPVPAPQTSREATAA